MLTNLLLACALVPSVAGVSAPQPNLHLKPIVAKASRAMASEHIPIFVVTPPTAASNTEYDVTVILDDVTPTNQVVSIATSRSASFSSMPSQVTVLAGDDRVTFRITTSATYQSATISASANGVTTMSPSIATEYINKAG